MYETLCACYRSYGEKIILAEKNKYQKIYGLSLKNIMNSDFLAIYLKIDKNGILSL
jgi:hypothetical protein